MSMRLESGATDLRRDLTVAAQEYADLQAQSRFIGLRVAPIFEVGEPEAYYPVINREAFVTVDETRRASDGGYNQVDAEFGSRPYQCEDRGLQTLLDDARRRRYSSYLDFEMAMTRILTHKVLLAQEKRIADLVIDATTYSATSASTAWSTAASAVPLTDIETGVNSIRQKSGADPMDIALILSYTDYLNMVRTDQVIEQVQYTFSANNGVRPATLSSEAVAQMLGVGQVLVGMSSYNSAVEGETVSMSGVWTSGYAMLAVVPDPNAPLETPSGWRTMLWTTDSPQNTVVERWRSEDKRGEMLRVRHNVDEVATSEADLVTYLIDTAP